MSYPVDAVDGDKILEEGEPYSLKWPTFQSDLASGLKTIISEPEFLTDVTLVAEGKRIRSHRMLLSICSPHFKELFKDFEANANTIVILNKVRYQDLQHVIQFMYTGEVKFSNNHELQGFLQTGELLQIEGITKNGSTNNEIQETDGQPPQRNGRVSPLAQSPPLPPTGGHRRSHHQANASVPSVNSIMEEHTTTGHIPPVTKRPRIAPSATVTSANYDDAESGIITPDINHRGEEMVDPLGSIPGGEEMTMDMDPLMAEMARPSIYAWGGLALGYKEKFQLLVDAQKNESGYLKKLQLAVDAQEKSRDTEMDGEGESHSPIIN